ncbi:MAG TPA: magnesium transporter, partial [Bacillota bacterium]
YYLYVTDEARRLQGVLTLRELVLADPDAVVGDLAERNVVHVHTDADQEQAARLIELHDLLAIPVVDSENRLVGIVTVDDAVDVLDRETTEDFARLAAMSAPAESGDHYFRLSYGHRLLRRLPWLLVLLIAQLISGGLISLFEDTLAAVLTMTVFIPMIMATSGNTGAQSVTLAVRGLATGEVEPRHFGRILAQELGTGFGLGLVLGLTASMLALALERDPRLGLAVAAAIWGNVIVVGGLGTLLPFVLRAVRVDPAVASAPLITTLGDAVSLVIYFNAVGMLYGI